MTEPLKILIEMTVNPDRYDLSQYVDQAEGDGWAREDENGAWYLAEEIISEHATAGLGFEIIP